jgi:hypothetical protein
MSDEPFCFWHSPDTAEEAAEARRLGGLHRRKKETVGAVFGFGGLRTIEDNQALLEDIFYDFGSFTVGGRGQLC